MKRLNFGSQAGILIGQDSHVKFVTESGVVFEAEKADIVARWPWYEFRGGVRLAVADKRYHLAFVKPNYETDLTDVALDQIAEIVPAAGLIQLAGIGRDIISGRAAGKAWYGYLRASERIGVGPEHLNSS